MIGEHDQGKRTLEGMLRDLDEKERSEQALAPLEQILKELREQRFFGIVELKFEAGRVVLLRKTETIKPENYRDNRGDNRGHQG